MRFTKLPVSLLFAIASIAALGQAPTIDPTSQIQWNLGTGTALPGCTQNGQYTSYPFGAQWGQTFTLTTTNQSYICGPSGWVSLGALFVGAGFQYAIKPPGSGTHFVTIAPSTCTPSANGTTAFATCGTPSGALYGSISATIGGFGNGGGVGSNVGSATWTFPALPSFITNPSHVTTVWLISSNGTSFFPGITGGTANNNFSSFDCNQGGTPISVLANSLQVIQVNELTGWNPANTAGITCVVTNNYSSPGLGITVNVPDLVLGVWYSTDPAPPSNTATLINPCLILDNNNGSAQELSTDPNCSFPASRITPATIPLLLATTYPVGTMFLVSNGANPNDCTTGGGAYPVLCVVASSGGYASYSIGGLVVGQVSSTSGTATAAHSFSAPFEGPPNCTAAPTTNAGSWYFSTQPTTTSSGVITYTTSGAQTFNIHCQGVNGAW